MKEQPIRILQIMYQLHSRDGISAVVNSWYRSIDTQKVQFDFLLWCHRPDDSLEKEYMERGARISILPDPYKHPLKFLKESYRFFKTHRYHTIHSHVTHLNLFFYPLAKFFGTKNIIQHAHLTKWSDKKLSGLRNYLMLHTVWPLITHKMACSQAAGKAYYGKNFTVVNNGIDVEKFTFNPSVRTRKRQELGLENNFVIGHIGRFALQKNHSFLVDIFAEVVKKDSLARLVLVGKGPLENDIKRKISQKGLQEKVLFLGSRTDVADLYQAFDAFCMPSFSEGLPVVGVEAQATGLSCVFADTITKEVLLLPTSSMLSLRDSAPKWAEQILKLKGIDRRSGCEVLRAKGFDICQTAKQIQDFYLGLSHD